MPYICPVCAYAGLPEPPSNFSICPSCGTEFGFDDSKLSHQSLRETWISEGAPWFSRARPHPAGWNPWLQLIEGGYWGALPWTARIAPGQANIHKGPQSEIRYQEYVRPVTA